MGNFSVTPAPRYLTHVSGLVPRYSPIPKPFGCGCALKYLFLCTSEHSHFHFQGLHHPHQPHPNTLSPYNQQALKLSHSQLVLGGAIIKKLASFRHKTQKFFFLAGSQSEFLGQKDTNGFGSAGRPTSPIFQNPTRPLLIKCHQYNPPGNKSA